MSVSTRNSQHGGENWLDQVFSGIELPKVENEQIHKNNMKVEEESILAELDEVLQKQRSASGSSTHTLQEVHEQVEEHFYDEVASEHHYHYIADSHDNKAEEPPVPAHRHQTYDSLAAEEVDEFPTDSHAIQPDLASLRHLQGGNRRQTIDSQVSATESHFGNFDVQDEEGRYKGSQIDLYHNEVAYVRPKKTVDKNDAISRQSISSYVQQVSETKARRASMISLAQSIKEQPNVSQNGKLSSVHIHNGHYSKQSAQILDTVIEFNKTVVEHLESGTLLQEIEGYGIVQPSFTEYYHEKFRHFIIGDYNKGLKEEEKTIMLIGESGVGKTSFIYSALNYLYGVEREYDFRFAIEPHNQIQPTRDQVNIYTFCNTVLNQKISIVDTPGIERDNSVELIKEWIKYRLNKRSQLKIDGLVVLEKHGQNNSNKRLEAKYSRLQDLLGGDIRSFIVPAYTFAKNYATVTRPNREFPNLPFLVESYSLFNNAGFFPTSERKLEQLINFKTSVASFDELFFAINYKLHPVVLAKRHH